MGKLLTVVELEWKMHLTEHGYTCYELIDTANSRRWGWIINAGEYGWTAHVGAWTGDDGMEVPVPDAMLSFKHNDAAHLAKQWVEDMIVKWWRTQK